MSQRVLPDPYLVPLAAGPIDATIQVPGSKSLSNRALPVAALARGKSRISNLLDSDDTRVMVAALRRLGSAIDRDVEARVANLTGVDGRFRPGNAELYLLNSGTSIRFLTALATLGNGTIRLDGNSRMRERPIGDLLDGLRQLGVDVRDEAGTGCPPVLLQASGLPGGTVTVRGNTSSQFLSGLLLAAPLAKDQLIIEVDGDLVSKPYVDMTLAVQEAFGVRCDRQGYSRFAFPAGQHYVSARYTVEPDASGASYFFGLAAVLGGKVTVPGLGRRSLQGDLAFVDVLERMGCQVIRGDDQTTVVGGTLRGVDVDMCHISDTVPTLAAVACFADGPTTIRNVAHVRVKETDRIAAVVTELRKLGLTVDERPDGLTIHPKPVAELRAAEFATYDDHRMAMSLALVGVRVPGTRLQDPGCTAKTYPQFFDDLNRALGR